MKPNIVIVGFRILEPRDLTVGWRLPDTEYWGFNNLFKRLPFKSFHRWFEIHNRRQLEKTRTWWDDELTFLRGMRMPIYMQRKHKDIPYSRAYPKRQVEALTRHGRYHMGSFDWMVAYAILRGAESITIEGCDLGPLDAGEPMSARACLEYWLGVAEGRGINTYVIGGSLFSWYNLVKKPLAQYGWDPSLHIVDIKSCAGNPPGT